MIKITQLLTSLLFFALLILWFDLLVLIISKFQITSVREFVVCLVCALGSWVAFWKGEIDAFAILRASLVGFIPAAFVV